MTPAIARVITQNIVRVLGKEKLHEPSNRHSYSSRTRTCHLLAWSDPPPTSRTEYIHPGPRRPRPKRSCPDQHAVDVLQPNNSPHTRRYRSLLRVSCTLSVAACTVGIHRRPLPRRLEHHIERNLYLHFLRAHETKVSVYTANLLTLRSPQQIRVGARPIRNASSTSFTWLRSRHSLKPSCPACDRSVRADCASWRAVTRSAKVEEVLCVSHVDLAGRCARGMGDARSLS